MKGFCCSAIFANNDVVQGEISLKWQFGFDIPTESFTIGLVSSRKQKIKSKQSRKCVLRMIFLSCQMARRICAYWIQSPHTVIAFQERPVGPFSNAETLFHGFGSTFFPFLSEGDWGSKSLAEIQMCPWRDMALCFLMTLIQFCLNPFRQRFDLNKLCRDYNELNLKELVLERALDNV